MKCPFCGKKMEKGYMYSGRTGSHWLPEDEKNVLGYEWKVQQKNGLWLIPPFNKVFFSPFKLPKVAMMVCRDCEKGIVDIPFEE